MKNYEINDLTQILMPISSNKTRIMENGNEYIVNKNLFTVIRNSCEYFGSSYEGRIEGSKNMLGVTYKVPIIIEESQNIIFFPTHSPGQKNCMWINLSQISNYFSNNRNHSTIIFKNGYNLEINISLGSLKNQVLKASRLQCILNQRVQKGY